MGVINADIRLPIRAIPGAGYIETNPAQVTALIMVGSAQITAPITIQRAQVTASITLPIVKEYFLTLGVLVDAFTTGPYQAVYTKDGQLITLLRKSSL